MQSKQSFRFGSIVSLLAGISLFAAILAYILWPNQMKFISSISDFYEAILSNALLYQGTFILFIVYAFLAMGTVIALQPVLPVHKDLMRWLSLLAIFGLGILALNSLYRLNAEYNLASQYVSAKDSFNGFGFRSFADPQGQLYLDVFSGSPLEKAGILSGDRVIAINGKSTEKMLAADLVTEARISGEAGAVFRVQTQGQEPREINVQRGPVDYWDIPTQRAIEAVGLPILDPNYLFSFGLMGAWLIVFNILSIRAHCIPPALGWSGAAAGVLFWLFPIGWIAGITAVQLAGAFGGLVAGPAWFVWMGVRLSKPLS